MYVDRGMQCAMCDSGVPVQIGCHSVRKFVPAMSLTLSSLQAVKVEMLLRMVHAWNTMEWPRMVVVRVRKLKTKNSVVRGCPGPGGVAKVETMRAGNKVGKRTASNAYCGVE